jgi:hypothetical protein
VCGLDLFVDVGVVVDDFEKEVTGLEADHGDCG